MSGSARAKTQPAPAPGTAASISPRVQGTGTAEKVHHDEQCLLLAHLPPPPGADGLVDPRLHAAYEALKKSDADGVGKITPAQFWAAFKSMIDAAEDKIELDALRPIGYRQGTDTQWEHTAYATLCKHDTNADGFLDRTELWTALNDIPLNIAALKPKEGSSADVMQIYDSIVASDEDNNGSIDGRELLHVMTSLRQTKRTTATLAKLLALAVVLILVLVGSFTGVSVAVVSAFKDAYAEDSTVTNGAVLTDGSLRPIGTVEAVVSLPMYAAPALPFEDLAQVKRLMLSYGSVEPRTRVMAYVTEVRQKNATSVTFELGCSRSVVVENGAAYLIDELEVVTPLCAANASCSAFTARQEIVDEVIARADADLAAIGVAHAGRRQLWHEGSCDSGDVPYQQGTSYSNKRGTSVLSTSHFTTEEGCLQSCANAFDAGCVGVSRKTRYPWTCRRLSSTGSLQTKPRWTTIVVSPMEPSPPPPSPPPPSPPLPEVPVHLSMGIDDDDQDTQNTQQDDDGTDCGVFNAGDCG